MMRSELNEIVREGREVHRLLRVQAASVRRPVAGWRPNKRRAGEVAPARLGWDIADFGRGDFEPRARFFSRFATAARKTGRS
jgi:D-lyxose ketol-isomerase